MTKKETQHMELPNGDVYSATHLDIPDLDMQTLEEITLNTHSASYEIARMLCQHCGTGAVDDDILEKYGLFNEGWNPDDEEEGSED